jgi:hypothetical protein
MLERRAAAVALNLASPTPPPAAPQSTLSSLFSRVYSSTPPDDAHAHRIRSDRKFYGWLERRFADYMHGVVGLQVVAPCFASISYFEQTFRFCFVDRGCRHVLMRL